MVKVVLVHYDFKTRTKYHDNINQKPSAIILVV